MSKEEQKVPAAPTPPADPTVPDSKRWGWPSSVRIPFVDRAYYEAFPKERRPVFQAGGASSVNIPVAELERLQALYAKPFAVETFLNMSGRPHILTIVGATPGSLIEVAVPPYGVLRADPNQLENIGQSGSNYRTFLRLSPAGDCEGLQAFEHKPTGTRFDTCRQHGCKRHTVPALVHSVHQALLHIDSIGDGMRSPLNPAVVDGEPPDEDQSISLIRAYLKVDPRPAVHLYGGTRINWLLERKTIRAATAATGYDEFSRRAASGQR